MATTDPTTGFVTHVESDVITPISTYVNDVITPINTWALARAIRSYKWADATARNAQAGMTAGDTGYQADTNIRYGCPGSAWVIWEVSRTTFSPAPTNFTSTPAATVTGSYYVTGGRVFWDASGTLGTSGITVGDIRLTMPMAMLTTSQVQYLTPQAGTVIYYDSSVGATGSTNGRFGGEVVYYDASTVQLLRPNISSAGVVKAVDATGPMTWAASDAFYATGSYIPA